MTFLEIAKDAIGRGLQVIPLLPRSKQAVEKGWQEKGYTDLIALEVDDYPSDSNCGALCSKTTTWILDIDSVDWFMDSFPASLQACLTTFTVKTGGGGYQYHFKQDDYSREKLSNKSLKNPFKDKYKKPTGAECEAVFDVLWDKHQGLLPGSVHPGTGKTYSVHKDLPIVPAPKELVDWVVTALETKARKQAEEGQSPFKVNPKWEMEKELEKHGLKWQKEEREGKVFYNYHAASGKCLVRGSSHAGPGEDPNPRQSAFVFDPKNQHFYHQCFSAGCEPGIANTKKALKALGIDWRDAFHVDGVVDFQWQSFDDIPKEHQRFMWKGYIPIGMLGHCAGESMAGKSPVTLDWCARISTGAPWPDGTPNDMGPRKVVIMAGEDDAGTVIRPRLELAGGRLSNIVRAKLRVRKGMSDMDKYLALDADAEFMIEAMTKLEGLALVIFDPITNYLGKAKMNAEEEVRPILMKLAECAQATGCCIMTVGHLNKREKGTNPMQRIMGAAAFKGVARFVHFFGADPEDRDKFSHVMVSERGWGATSLKYATQAVKMTWDGEESDVLKVDWRGPSEATAEDVCDPQGSKSKTDEANAAKELKKFLSSGKKSAEDCKQFLSDAGYVLDGKDGLNAGRVRKKAGATTEHKDKKNWWMLAAANDIKEEEGMF